MTREVDPKRLVVWTLERFAARLGDYLHDIYDQMDHKALGQTPREAFEQGMLRAGSRVHTLIPYSEAFLLQTRPSTRTGVVKIHAAKGITVNGLQYWNECMRSPSVVGQTVPVRYEAFDLGFAYAYIDGQWMECTADNFLQVHGRSERERNLIVDEWREQQRQHNSKRATLNGTLLAQFLREVEQDEAWLLARQHELEEQPLRSALLLQTPFAVSMPENGTSSPIELDLTAIPHYEEYH